MSRTNIEIDEDLIGRVMERYRLPTKRAAVDYALRRLDPGRSTMTRDEALAMHGAGWGGDLDEIRAPWEPPDLTPATRD